MNWEECEKHKPWHNSMYHPSLETEETHDITRLDYSSRPKFEPSTSQITATTVTAWTNQLGPILRRMNGWRGLSTAYSIQKIFGLYLMNYISRLPVVRGPGTLEQFPCSDANTVPTSRQRYAVCHGILNTKKPSIYGNLIEDSLVLIQVQSSEGNNNSVIRKLKLLIAIIFSLRFYGCNLFLSFMISWYTNYWLEQWRANKPLGHEVTAMWQGGGT
jgi:hypothetical protein